MPMRIIGRGRDAYVLAGYLHKRGKWSWQWSERYFVLTKSALHYYKKEKSQLFGEERGHFLVEDMMVRYFPETKSFEVFVGGKTRMLRAPTEREYLTWAKAFQDVLALVPQRAKQAQAQTQHNHTNNHNQLTQQQAQTGAGANTLTHNRTNTAAQTHPHNSAKGVNQTNGKMIASPGAVDVSQKNVHRVSKEAAPLPTYNTTSKPNTPLTQTDGHESEPGFARAHSASNLLATNNSNNNNQNATTRLPGYTNANNAAVLSGHMSSTLQSSMPPLHRISSAPLDADSLNSVPVFASHHKPTNHLSETLQQGTALGNPIINSNISMLSHPISHSSTQDSLLMVVVEGGSLLCLPSLQNLPPHTTSPSQPPLTGPSPDAYIPYPRIIAGTNVPWGNPLYIPAFGKGSAVVATLGDGSKVRIEREALETASGEKLFQVDDLYRPTQVLIRWNAQKLHAGLLHPQNLKFFMPSVAPVIFLLLYAYCAFAASPTQTTLHSILAFIGFVGAIYQVYSSLTRYIQETANTLVWTITFVSPLEKPIGFGMTTTPGLTSVFDQPFHHTRPELERETSNESIVGVPEPAHIHHSIAPNSARKKKGILRRRSDAAHDHHHTDTDHSHTHLHRRMMNKAEMDENSDSAVHVNSHLHRRKGTMNQHIKSLDHGLEGEGLNANYSSNTVNSNPDLAASSSMDSSGDEESQVSRLRPSHTAQATPLHSEVSTTEFSVSTPSTTLVPSLQTQHEGVIMIPVDSDATSPTHDDSLAKSQPMTPALSETEEGLSRGETHDEDDLPFETEVEWSSDDDDFEDRPLVFNANNLPPYRDAPWGRWTEDDTSVLKLRGPTFLQDKIKIPCGSPIFKLINVEMFYTARDKDKLMHVMARPDNWGHRYLERKLKKHQLHETDIHGSLSPSSILSPLFVINFLYPGPNNRNMNLVLYFSRRVRTGEELKKRQAFNGEYPEDKDKDSKRRSAGRNQVNSDKLNNTAAPAQDNRATSPTPIEPETGKNKKGSKKNKDANNNASSSSTSCSSENKEEGTLPDAQRVSNFDRVLKQFLEGSDDFRDGRLKIVPRIAEGSWIVKKGVGCVPAILGKKIKQWYYRDLQKNYLEIVADVSSSVIAGRILSLVKGAATSLIIELSFTLQGEAPDELPESLLGGVRLQYPNMDKMLDVDDHERLIAKQFEEEDKEA